MMVIYIYTMMRLSNILLLLLNVIVFGILNEIYLGGAGRRKSRCLTAIVRPSYVDINGERLVGYVQVTSHILKLSRGVFW